MNVIRIKILIKDLVKDLLKGRVIRKNKKIVL